LHTYCYSFAITYIVIISFNFLHYK